ncbi:50S ribosomal protein L29 [Vibrio alfacsensis]|uniref:50S ribosomal protein L29 n=1 Tax=Vibrio alfacsensis TaxID=1074311 RepID=A0ABN5PHN0_9VIBR|nr:uL29 family ribosomal protein [Vibrio alfacsensis]AXY02704.1 50S ribosomal protein L29 [Vibrio alfacsensis]
MEFKIKLLLLKMYILSPKNVPADDISLMAELNRFIDSVLGCILGLKTFEVSYNFEQGVLAISNVTFKVGRQVSEEELEQKLNEWLQALFELRQQLMDIIYGDYDDTQKRDLVKECLEKASSDLLVKKHHYLKSHTLRTEDGVSTPPFEKQYDVYESPYKAIENGFSGKHSFENSDYKGTKFADTNSCLNGIPYCFELPDDLPDDIDFEAISFAEFDCAFREATHEGCALVFSGILALTEFTKEPKRFYVQSVHAKHNK